MRAAILGAVLAVAGCGGDNGDACAHVSGTCVSLRVESGSAAISAVDRLHLTASGAATGEKDSAGARAALPVLLAVTLPADANGPLHLMVDAFLDSMLEGSCTADPNVSPGAHSSATCTLTAAGGGDGGADDGGVDGSVDGSIPKCDPGGVVGPRCVWRWQNPLPQGDDYAGVVAFSDSDTFALTNDGLVLHRDAVGWSPMPARPTPADNNHSLSGLFAGDSNNLFVSATTGSTPLVYRSFDGAQTWMAETLPGTATGFFGSGAASGGNAVVPGSSGQVLVRSSGVWSLKTAGAGSYYDAAMSSGGKVLIAGNNGTNANLAYSLDSGSTWTVVASPPVGQISGACVGQGATTQFWAVGQGNIYKWDGVAGHAFVSQTSPVPSGLQDCVATDDTHVWAFGANGTVIYSTDGTTWMGLPVPVATAETFSAAAHSPGAAMTLVGSKGALYRSTNGTAFANELSGPPQKALQSIFGVAPGNLYAVGSAGSIYHTTDEGQTWSKLSAAEAGTTSGLFAVWGTSPTDVYAVGLNGTLLHSSDGVTFTKGSSTAPPTTTFFKDVWGSPTLGTFAIGTDGTGPFLRVVWRTTDHGATWQPLTITGFTGVSGSGQTVFADGTDVWVAGDGGNVYHSTDGTMFTQQTTGVTLGITQIRGINGDLFALLGSDPGSYLHSTDKGVNWGTPVASVFPDSGLFMTFTPTESTIFVFSAGGPVSSTNHGATWMPFLEPTAVMAQGELMALFAFADNDIYVAGTTGIIHYGN